MTSKPTFQEDNYEFQITNQEVFMKDITGISSYFCRRLVYISIFLSAALLAGSKAHANINVQYKYPGSTLTSYTVNLIQNKLVKLAGANFPGDITVRLLPDKGLKDDLGEEGYRVSIGPSGITIRATAEIGLLYGGINLIEWVIAQTTAGIQDHIHADIDFPVNAGQAREFLQNLPKDQFESKPFYPLRFFLLNNFAMGVADLIDTEIILEKHNFYSGVEGGFGDAIHTWKTWCDWGSRHRVNRLSNWPYSAGTNWWDLAIDPATKGMSKYPEGEIVKAAGVREELFKYARSRGLKPYLMNYLTGSATHTIVKNHPEIIGELDSNDKDHTGSISFCHANDGLKKVFTAQIRAILRTYPSLAGLHIRWWGESYPCQCKNCKGRQGELQMKLTMEIVAAALDERPDIEILLSGRLFMHGTQEFWDHLPKNVILQAKWGIDWEPTADPKIPFDSIVKTGHPFLISEALPGEEVHPFGSVQYLPYRDGLIKYAKGAKQVPNLRGFSVAVADKDFGWITETNYMTAAKLNWAPLEINIEDFIGNYLRTTYGDAQEDIYKSLELIQKAWEEYCVDFDGIGIYKDYMHITWMHGLDSVRNADPQELKQNIKRIEKHSQMLTQAIFILGRARNKVNPQALVAFDDIMIQTEIFAEFFTSRQLLAEAFIHQGQHKKERMRNKLKMVYESNQRLIKLALSKPNIVDYFEMEGMTFPTNYQRGYIYLTLEGAWDFLQNRIFEEMDELEKLISIK
jgi:hypothetical protein